MSNPALHPTVPSLPAVSGPPLPYPMNATLMVVDIQERLLPAMPEDEQASVVKHAANLVALWAEKRGNVVYSEQYPRGLGSTVAALADELAKVAGVKRIEKTAFSACQDASYNDEDLKADVVLVGMEAHVCVLLTGFDLIARGHRVFVPHDAVASRSPRNRDNGLALLQQQGAVIVNAESLIFNTLGKAGGDAFKRFSARIR